MKSKNIWASFKFAWLGILYAFKSQRNVKIHFFVALLVLILSVLLRIKLLEMAVIILAIGLVIVAEMINTAIEAVVDLASPELHPLAEVAKNVAAGAVLLTALCAVLIGSIILTKYLIPL